MAEALVVVTSSFPISGDGSEAAGSFVADLVAELANNAPIRVVAPGRDDSVEQWQDRVEVIRFAAPRKALSTLRFWHPIDLYWIYRVLRGGQAAVNRALGTNTRHVIALWGLPCGEWARRAVRRLDINYSVWMLGSDVWTFGRIPLLRWMLARVMRQAENAWADGYKLAEDAAGIGGVPVNFLPSARLMTLQNPAPPRQKAPYRLLFLGRWHINKGVDLLLDALTLLSDEDWQCIEGVEIHGGGPMHDLVHECVGMLRASGRLVEVGGFLPKAQAEAAIARADWLVIPSRIESIPVIFSDALKLGRPVIATPVGDMPRLLGKLACGVLAEAVDSSSIAKAIQVATSAPLTVQVAKSAQEAFSLSRITARMLNDVAGNLDE